MENQIFTPSDTYTITLPRPPEGSDGWRITHSLPLFGVAPPDTRTRYQKAMYRVIMYLHNRAEGLWHWLYSRSHKYSVDPPKEETGGSYSMRIVSREE